MNEHARILEKLSLQCFGFTFVTKDGKPNPRSLASLLRKAKKQKPKKDPRSVAAQRQHIVGYYATTERGRGEIDYIPNNDLLYRRQIAFAKAIGLDLSE